MTPRSEGMIRIHYYDPSLEDAEHVWDHIIGPVANNSDKYVLENLPLDDNPFITIVAPLSINDLDRLKAEQMDEYTAHNLIDDIMEDLNEYRLPYRT